MKKCSNCNKQHIESNFYSKSNICKPCISAKRRFYRENNPDKVKANKEKWYSNNKEHCKNKANKWLEDNRRKHNKSQLKWAHKNLDKRRNIRLKYDYNITLEDYNSMQKAQNNSCAICGNIDDSRLHVDHCHNTNNVRGLLCGKCNRGLGMFDDSPETLHKAIKYLEEKK